MKERVASLRLPSNWRSRLCLIKQSHSEWGYIEYHLRFKQGRTPRGFHSFIGSFELYLDTDKVWVIHSDIDSHFQGRGLGLTGYLTILHDLKTMRSYFHKASDPAKGLWKKIAALKYPMKLDFWNGSITIKSGKAKFQGFEIKVELCE